MRERQEGQRKTSAHLRIVIVKSALVAVVHFLNVPGQVADAQFVPVKKQQGKYLELGFIFAETFRSFVP